MKIQVFKKIIERNNCPHRRDLNRRINNVSKEFVGQFKSSSPPEIGEILYFEEENLKYKVVNKIRVLNEDEEFMLLEVVSYDGMKLYTCGSDTWEEYVPLVCDIDDKKD